MHNKRTWFFSIHKKDIGYEEQNQFQVEKGN